MGRQYQPKRFFRNIPNKFLQRYFHGNNVLTDIAFDKLSETQVDPIYNAWLQVPEEHRSHMEQEFQEIDDLATEGGSKAILDEARWHGEDLAAQFALLHGFYEHAFWTFLERPTYWSGAVAFHRADTIPGSYWRKRKNLPRKAAKVDDQSIEQLQDRLGSYFYQMQGRGKNCKVDRYKRDNLDYFFAYPEDYSKPSIEWVKKEFKRRSHNPAFEIIFVYSQDEGALNIFLSGDRKPVPDLQAIFANVILDSELPADPKDERVYDLGVLLASDFQFIYEAGSGIDEVLVKKLRLKIRNVEQRIVIEADPSKNHRAVFDLLGRIGTTIPLSQLLITQVGIQVNFSANSPLKRKSRTFDISYPCSCSLRFDECGLIIKKMLVDSGLEPKQASSLDGATT